jgi:hypothetical protein
MQERTTKKEPPTQPKSSGLTDVPSRRGSPGTAQFTKERAKRTPTFTTCYEKKGTFSFPTSEGTFAVPTSEEEPQQR